MVDAYNHRVQKFDTEGNFLSKFSRFERNTDGDGVFNNPSDLAFDRKGRIYVTDSHHHIVQKFDSEGNFILKFRREGNKNGEFDYPRCIAINRKEN